MTRPPAEDGIYLQRTPEGFSFASEYDRELGARYGVGSIVRADIIKPRSGKHQRWYRALIRAVWKQQDHYVSPDGLHLALKFRLGHVDHIVMHNGEAILMPKSTSYDTMDQGAFKEFVDRTFDVIVKEIIPGLDRRGREELVREVDRLLAGTLR